MVNANKRLGYHEDLSVCHDRLLTWPTSQESMHM